MKVRLVKDWVPFEGARVRPAGRVAIVGVETGRALIAEGIAVPLQQIEQGSEVVKRKVKRVKEDKEQAGGEIE